MKTKKEEMKKVKGVKKNVFKKDISQRDYVDCLFEERKFMYTMQTIPSFKQQPSNRIKSTLALTMINDTLCMVGLTLCLINILVCCKYSGTIRLFFSENSVVYFDF